jgi:membrane associated rhomboid family serine protease
MLVESNSSAPARLALPIVTIVLIAICLIVFVGSSMGQSRAVLSPLFIASRADTGFSEILAGQVWRLLTPVFIHFSLLHIFFNLYWVWGIGALLERKIGRGFLLGFLVVVGIVSNVAQYVLSGSPYFGGMSGVIYGLLGYLWIQGQFNPRFGRYLPTQSVVILLVWFVLCWVGVLGAIANWAHTAGLLAGLLWGAIHVYAGRHTPA